MKTIAISGASGFVGTHLSQMFIQNGYNVLTLTRDIIKNKKQLPFLLNDCDGVINLSGANIIARWSNRYKKTLYDSRINTTKALIEAMRECQEPPRVFISTSAVGIYDTHVTHTESSKDLADDFLAKLCQDWEHEALKAQELGIRTAIFRFGIVLGNNGGALKQMLLPFKLGLGGTIGDGKQAFSFIHINDLLSAYNFVLDNPFLKGVFNLCAPKPTTNLELTKTLGEVLHRPTLFPVPHFALKLLFSEGAQVLCEGQSAVPQKLLQEGFHFQYPTIQTTLEALLDESERLEGVS